MKPQKSISLNLEQDDIREDLKRILLAMRKIRRESIKDNDFNNQIKEEYLHLTSRLGSIIQENEEPWVLDRVSKLVEGNGDIKIFDTLQRSRAKSDPIFYDALQNASILLLGHNYTDLNDSYHCLQAIKYLNTPSEDWEGHKENCHSVKPFQEPQIEKRKGWKGLVSRLLGYNYEVSDKKGLEITLGKMNPYPQELLSHLKEQGYVVINGSLRRKDFKSISMGEGKKEQVGKGSEDHVSAKLTLLNLERRLTPNFVDVFSEHAAIQLSDHVERNLSYKVGRPSLFGRGAKEKIGIEEFDYRTLSQMLHSELKVIAKEKSTFPEPTGRSQEDFERFVERLKRTSDKLRRKDFNLGVFPLYKKGDVVVIARNHGSQNNRENDEFYYGSNINRTPLGTIGKITGTKKDDYEFEDKKRTIHIDLGHEEPFKLAEGEVEPDNQTKRRFVDAFIEKVKDRYLKEGHGPKIDFVADPDREVLYYTTTQIVGDYHKGTYIFLHPGKRTIVCGFQKGNNLEGIVELGKKLISGDYNARDVAEEYFGSHEHVPYLSVIQFEDGEKVNDFEVRK